MDITLFIWRQKDKLAKGKMKKYQLTDISPEISFLEMLDKLNLKLIREKDEDGPVAFESDCREGICGACGIMINGRPHGPLASTTTCQLHMRSFKDKSEIYLEPFRAKNFPIIRDLVVDRTAFDEIIQEGGYISVNTGSACEASSISVSKNNAELAMDHAACIGCAACVAICKNASAMLFTSAKINHLNLLPQGLPEKNARVNNMVNKMQELGFGNCTNEGECAAICPKDISLASIAKMNRDYISNILSKNEV